MRTALLATLLFAPLASSPLAAQREADVLGVWEGPYQSEAVPPGTLKLTVARGANKEWQVTLEIFADQPPAAGPVKDFKLEGNKISFSQEVAEMNCVSTGTITSGVLKGTAECSQNGAVVVTATFLLEKKKT
jgi:hypothetical protein